jgi:hypothetical protein
MATREQISHRPSPGEKAQHGVTMIAVVLLVGVAVLSVGVTVSAGSRPAAGAIGAGVTMFLLFTASAAIGAALGFLFGLPRARFTDELSAAAGSIGATGGAPAAPLHPSAHYLANSNLIKVSDWLTTIVIGLGLVNLGGLLPALRTLATALKDPLGGAAYAGAIGISVMVVGVLAGFVLVYVFTTIRIRQLLEDAEDQWDLAPDLRRTTLAEARNKISATGLRLKAPDGAPDDAIVVQQSMEPGAPVHVGSQIEVTLAGSADAAEAQAGASGSGHRAGNGVGRIPRQ